MKSSRDFGFNEIFLTPIDFSSKFDYHVRLVLPDLGSSVLSRQIKITVFIITSTEQMKAMLYFLGLENNFL